MNRLISIGLTLLGLTGCGGPPTAPATVRGRVLLHGRPLAGGMIVFTPDIERGLAGRPIATEIQASGDYALPEGTPPGWYRVSLSDPPGAWTADGVHFPSALRRPDLSGLVREVRPGQTQPFDFHIDWKRAN